MVAKDDVTVRDWLFVIGAFISWGLSQRLKSRGLSRDSVGQHARVLSRIVRYFESVKKFSIVLPKVLRSKILSKKGSIIQNQCVKGSIIDSALLWT